MVALVRGPRVWVANAGDSRALVAGRRADGAVVARGLTRDQVTTLTPPPPFSALFTLCFLRFS